MSQSNLKIKFKLNNSEAVLPSYSREGDNGLDLTAASVSKKERFTEYDTGVSVEIPEGYVGLVFPRSSVSKKDQLLANSVGVIDQNYRGTIRLRFKTVNETPSDTEIYKVGDRIGQLIIVPNPKIEVVEENEELESTERGEEGFGSSGD